MQLTKEEVHISNYKFSKTNILGKGSTGTVYLGRDIRNGEKVAIKTIEMETIDNEVTTYLLSNEKKALAALKHPNIISTYEIIQDKQNCYIVGEYCSGGTLYDLIKAKGKLQQTQALHLFRNIVQGYKECVKLGITHRDLKPANILLNEGVPKIIDFGYAEIFGVPKPKMYYNVGSPSYMAPQSALQNIYSQKSDIWALGVSFYEMLTGQIPIDTTDIVKTFQALTKTGVIFPTYISIYCRQIINRCLTPNIQKRIGLNQLCKLLRCEQLELTPPIRRERPMTQINEKTRGKSVDNTVFLKVVAPNQNNQHALKPTIQHVPLALQNKNSPQAIWNNEYFTQPTQNKKLVSTESKNRPNLMQKAINSHSLTKQDLRKLQPTITFSVQKKQQRLNQPSKFSRQKQVIVRPVSMNSNMFSSIHKNIGSGNYKNLGINKSSQNNIIRNNFSNPQGAVINPIKYGTPVAGFRPISPGANIPMNNRFQNLRYTQNNPVYPIGMRPNNQPQQIQVQNRQRPQSPAIFFNKHYS